MKFKRGTVLFKEGFPNDEIFIVLSGEFQGVRNMNVKSTNHVEPVM